MAIKYFEDAMFWIEKRFSEFDDDENAYVVNQGPLAHISYSTDEGTLHRHLEKTDLLHKGATELDWQTRKIDPKELSNNALMREIEHFRKKMKLLGYDLSTIEEIEDYDYVMACKDILPSAVPAEILTVLRKFKNSKNDFPLLSARN